MNQKEWLLITVGIFLTVIAWVIADIYHVSKTNQVRVKFNAAQSVKIKIDKKIFKELEKKFFEGGG